jgi:hypothetical protein
MRIALLLIAFALPQRRVLLVFPHSSQVVVSAHDGSSGLRNGVMLAPSGSSPILPSGVS